jgi:hypothetical protein
MFLTKAKARDEVSDYCLHLTDDEAAILKNLVEYSWEEIDYEEDEPESVAL